MLVRTRQSPKRWVSLSLCAFLLAGAPAWGQSTSAPRSAATAPRLVHLAPGASVKDRPPAGWTYRPVRSVPKLASGELDSLPETAAATASLFRTVIAIKVVRRGNAYELAQVGVGNAIPVGQKEVVVTSEGPEDAIGTLGFVDRIVLKEAEAELNKGRLIAQTPTFAMYRAPSILVVGGKHVAIDLTYAFLIDKNSGALTTFVWAVPSGVRAAVSKIIELPQAASFDTAVDVKVTQWLGPVPLAWSFAMAALPPGRPVEVPADTKQLVADAGKGADSSALERALQTLASSSRVQ